MTQTIPSAVAEGLACYGRDDIDAALAEFSRAFATGLGLEDHLVAPVLTDVVACLLNAFDLDAQSPAAYDFLRSVSPEVAEIMAGLLMLANFLGGNIDLATVERSVLLG